jgi:hypothetical protein
VVDLTKDARLRDQPAPKKQETKPAPAPASGETKEK